MSTIPHDWLAEQVGVDEVEEELTRADAPDYWLKQWRTFLDQFAPGDELWTYDARISMSDLDDLDVVDRCGFARVNNGELLDWIEAHWF